jgi:hypothetical protein
VLSGPTRRDLFSRVAVPVSLAWPFRLAWVIMGLRDAAVSGTAAPSERTASTVPASGGTGGADMADA